METHFDTASQAHKLDAPIRPVDTRHLWINYLEPRSYDAPYENSFHTGVDISAKEGTEILSPRVRFEVIESKIALESGWGNRVIIRLLEGPWVDHYLGYCHLKGLSLGYYKGAIIDGRINRCLGTVGSTGKTSTGPHLHLMACSPGSNPLFWDWQRQSEGLIPDRLINPLDVFNLLGGPCG